MVRWEFETWHSENTDNRLVDRNGKVAGRFSPSTTPEQLQPEIEKLLAAPRPATL